MQRIFDVKNCIKLLIDLPWGGAGDTGHNYSWFRT